LIVSYTISSLKGYNVTKKEVCFRESTKKPLTICEGLCIGLKYNFNSKCRTILVLLFVNFHYQT
jgi:SET domain-containing protein